MLDLAGTELTAEDRELLSHPAVGGVILFARNHTDPDQVRALTGAIAAVRDPALLIAVDQEGGRVQRFDQGFTRLPAPSRFVERYAREPEAARHLAASAGWLMATELGQVGVDFSFAPVLDIEQGVSRVIRDRAFGTDADMVVDLAGAWMAGAADAGMASCGKHFPGHGGVVADSHVELPYDHRPLAELQQQDMVPFARMIANGLPALMPSHVIYTAVDDRPAGFSRIWLQEILRHGLGFDGMLFSDDLDMGAAAAGGGFGERTLAALEAGCDMAVICNNRAGVIQAVDTLGADYASLGPAPDLARRTARMVRRSRPEPDPARRQQVLEALSALETE